MGKLEKAIEIMDCISNSDISLSLAELNEKLNIHKSTIFRILKILVEYNMVHKDEGDLKYRIGFHILNYYYSFLKFFNIRKIIKPHLKEICSKTDENVFLTTSNGNEFICTESELSSKKRVKLFVEVGRKLPFHCTAAAKVILAYQSKQYKRKLINKGNLIKYTSKTIVNPNELEKHLEKIKLQGFAVCDGEFEEGVRAVSAPIKNEKGEILASITVTWISNKGFIEKFNLIKRLIMDSAERVSKELGFRE